MPLGDWQFWVVTLAALLSAAWLGRGLLRIVLPGRRRGNRDVELTVERDQPRSRRR